MRFIRPVVGLALVAVLATACADGAGEPDPTAGATPPPSATGPPETPTGATPGPTGAAPGAPGAPAPGPTGPLAPVPTEPRGADLTLTGEVVAGVEDGCKLLSTGEGDYLLFGALSRDLRYGSTVTVRGRLRPDIASTCQQGTPFEVTEVLD